MRAFILLSLLFASVLAFHLQKNEFLDEEYLTRTVRSAEDSSSSEENEKAEAQGNKVEEEDSSEASGDKDEKEEKDEKEDEDGSGARFIRDTDEGSGDKSNSSEEDEDEGSGERFVREVEEIEGSGELISSQSVSVVDEEGSGEGADETFFKEPAFFF